MKDWSKTLKGEPHLCAVIRHTNVLMCPFNAIAQLLITTIGRNGRRRGWFFNLLIPSYNWTKDGSWIVADNDGDVLNYSNKKKQVRKSSVRSDDSSFTHYEEFQNLHKYIPDLKLNTVTHLRKAGLKYGVMQGGSTSDLGQLGRWFDGSISQAMQLHYLYNVNMNGLFPMAGISINTNIPDNQKYNLPRARTMDVIDLDAIYNDMNYRGIIEYIVPGLLWRAFVARKAYTGEDIPKGVPHDMSVIPESLSNFKFCIAAVGSVVSWIQDAVVLTDPSYGFGDVSWFDREPFSFLKESSIVHHWETVQRKVLNAMCTKQQHELPISFQQSPQQVYTFFSNQNQLNRQADRMSFEKQHSALTRTIVEQNDRLVEENIKQTNRLIAHLEKMHRMRKVDDIQSKKRALEEAVEGENLHLSIQITPCSDTVDISDITSPSKSSPIESVVEITGEGIEDTTNINTNISQAVVSSQSLKGIGCVEGIVKEWDSSFRHMIQMSETTSKSKLENIKIKNYQKKSREGALYLCVNHAGNNQTQEVCKVFQTLVEELNLTKTDVYDHCLILKKEMDDLNWAVEADAFRERLLCKSSLQTLLKKRKDGQKQRQAKAIVRRKELRERKKSEAIAERQEIDSILGKICE